MNLVLCLWTELAKVKCSFIYDRAELVLILKAWQMVFKSTLLAIGKQHETLWHLGSTLIESVCSAWPVRYSR
jgi:hypothetical protein